MTLAGQCRAKKEKNRKNYSLEKESDLLWCITTLPAGFASVTRLLSAYVMGTMLPQNTSLRVNPI
jgi:hypothetical protein